MRFSASSLLFFMNFSKHHRKDTLYINIFNIFLSTSKIVINNDLEVITHSHDKF